MASPPASSRLDSFLTDNLRLWKETTEHAPANELQSISAWLRYLSEHGEKKTIETMQARIVLLIRTATALNDLGPEAEDAAGIFTERPRESFKDG